jgi:hypothetical protein
MRRDSRRYDAPTTCARCRYQREAHSLRIGGPRLVGHDNGSGLPHSQLWVCQPGCQSRRCEPPRAAEAGRRAVQRRGGRGGTNCVLFPWRETRSYESCGTMQSSRRLPNRRPESASRGACAMPHAAHRTRVWYPRHEVAKMATTLGSQADWQEGTPTSGHPG